MVLEIGAAWVWENFGKELLANLGDVSKQWIDKVNWSRASNAYREKVRDLYGEIRVLGSSQPTPLGNIFTDVYILDKPTAYRRFDLTELRQDPEKLKREERIEGVVLVQQEGNERLYILGQPGAGKTTFLKYLALQAVEGKIDRIPIFVGLKQWADSDMELMDFIALQFAICSFPDALLFIEHILRNGKALVLFDGLDEVPQEANRRTRIIQDLTNFSNQYNDCQCVITCRIAATDYSFTRFTYVEVAPFTDEQIETYVHKWFADQEQKRDLFLQELVKHEHRGLREMASTPLLLSMLCLAFDQTMHFPQRRVEVYDEAIEALLKKWDTSRSINRDEVYEKLTLGRKRQMFARIAAETFQQGEYFLDQEDVEKRIAAFLHRLSPVERAGEIDTEVILKAIEAQHGILVQRAHRIYSFAHLSFQEYFTAKYLADNQSEKLFTGMFQQHLTDTRWREVFLLLASLLDDADLFFQCFQHALDALAAQDETLVEILRWMERKAAAVPAEHHKPAAVRSVYCFFDRDPTSIHKDVTPAIALARGYSHAHVIARTLDKALGDGLDSILSRALDSDIVHEATFNLVLALKRALERAHTGTLNIDVNRSLRHAISLINTLDPALALDMLLFYGHLIAQTLEYTTGIKNIYSYPSEYSAYIQKTTELAHDIGLDELADALEHLNVPTADAAQNEWQSFSNVLQTLMHQHRDIGHEWELSLEQAKRFADYLQASKLLLDCLQLASVADRTAIEERLLLPPPG
jgi:energy-coupling factor transporter ATP-binding protein EcfA2